MRSLEEKIIREGEVIDGKILNVGSFLNQQIDPAFMTEIGNEIARIYEGLGATKVFTIEASGIAVALAAGIAMNIPAVFAKKHRSSNVPGDVYATMVHSYTHSADYRVVVSCDCITADDKVILVDDFLASGNAFIGLADLAKQAGAEILGATAVIEKGFQGGGELLRSAGVRVESLAVIDSMDAENGIAFR